MKKNVYLVRIYNGYGKPAGFERFTYTSEKYVVKAMEKLFSNSLYKACLDGKGPYRYEVLLDNDFDGKGEIVERVSIM